MTQEVQGIDDQYVLTCCMAQYKNKNCVMGLRVKGFGRKALTW